MERKYLIIHVCTLLCGLIIGGVAVYLMNRNTSCSTEGYIRKSPTEYSQVYGIDVSYWQGNILWDQLSLPCEDDGSVSGRIPAPHYQRPVQFAFIRATKSGDIVDPLYQRNYEEAKKFGIHCGTYHFLTDKFSGKTQAEFFLSHIKFEQGDLPPVLDVEIDSPDIVAKAKEWLEIVEGSCGVKAIIYTNMYVYSTRIKEDSVLSTRDLWLAQSNGCKPTEPNCRFWQFTHKGHVWGIIDNVVDINLFNGTLEELKAYIEEKGFGCSLNP